jgi:hypothetical protein
MAKMQKKKTTKSKFSKVAKKSKGRKTSTKRRGTSTPAKQVRRAQIKPNGSTQAHHAVIQRPFSNATTQPKIPDGIMTTSLSRRQQTVFQMQNRVGSTECYCLMYAAEGAACSLYQTAGAFLTQANDDTWDPKGFVGQNAGRTKASNNEPLINESGVAQWRTVSQGIKFSLINPSEEDDGYWEAVRVPLEKRTDAMALVPLNKNAIDAHKINNLGLFFNDEYYDIIKSHEGSLVEQPGYQSGMLRDIHKKEFMLRHTGDFGDPQVNHRNLKTQLFEANKRYNMTNNLDCVAIEDEMLDDNMDMVLIKFTCRPNSGSGNTTGSRFLVNAIKNIEFTHSPDSDMRSYEVKTAKDHTTEGFIIGLQKPGAGQPNKDDGM